MSPRLSQRMRNLRLNLGSTLFMICIMGLSVGDLFILEGELLISDIKIMMII